MQQCTLYYWHLHNASYIGYVGALQESSSPCKGKKLQSGVSAKKFTQSKSAAPTNGCDSDNHSADESSTLAKLAKMDSEPWTDYTSEKGKSDYYLCRWAFYWMGLYNVHHFLSCSSQLGNLFYFRCVVSVSISPTNFWEFLIEFLNTEELYNTFTGATMCVAHCGYLWENSCKSEIRAVWMNVSPLLG